jgi:hypothetical protein
MFHRQRNGRIRGRSAVCRFGRRPVPLFQADIV